LHLQANFWYRYRDDEHQSDFAKERCVLSSSFLFLTSSSQLNSR